MDTVTLSGAEVREAVTMADAIAAVREGFLGLARGEFEMPTRTALRDGQFLVMSVHHTPTATAITKALSLNFAGRHPAIVGTVTWSDLEHTGHLIADAAAVTALRTGAAAGVATDLLAGADASTLTVIGAGRQAADQVRAVHAVRPLTEVTLVARSHARADALATQLAAEFPALEITAGTDADAAVESADVVCCVTTSTEPLFACGSLRPDVHVNAIGAFRPTMRELPDDLLADVGTVHIDEKHAALEESGELIHALRTGAITESSLTELGSALATGIPPRPGRTVFKSVGVAMQDWAVARLLAARFLRT
ncbi:ornithine cyclodeaminase family protein [Kribbella sp. HUAS MG21]|uniref:Ornithine cyclodeaminase family protein n=1 Tax=Kribbella sp. HUAS MG21 TaxID=3160966 RepID=A0AAU7T7Y3_9ACTN